MTETFSMFLLTPPPPPWGVGTLRGLGGGTLGEDLRLLTCPLGLQGERVVPGLPKFKFFSRRHYNLKFFPILSKIFGFFNPKNI